MGDEFTRQVPPYIFHGLLPSGITVATCIGSSALSSWVHRAEICLRKNTGHDQPQRFKTTLASAVPWTLSDSMPKEQKYIVSLPKLPRQAEFNASTLSPFSSEARRRHFPIPNTSI